MSDVTIPARDQLVAAVRRTIAHVVAGTVPTEESVLRVPAANYYDAGRWALEMDRIFRRLPFLCGYAEMLETLDLASCWLVGRQQLEGPNWKVAYDGYLDFYHLPILHKDTFGPDFGNHTITDAWGPHQRNTQPDPRLARLA